MGVLKTAHVAGAHARVLLLLLGLVTEVLAAKWFHTALLVFQLLLNRPFMYVCIPDYATTAHSLLENLSKGHVCV